MQLISFTVVKLYPTPLYYFLRHFYSSLPAFLFVVSTEYYYLKH